MLPRSQIRFLRICIAALLFFFAITAHGQGCSMCRDTTAGSAPQIRAALRKAIPVLAVPAIVLFAGFFLLARRTDMWHREETTAEQRPNDEQS